MGGCTSGRLDAAAGGVLAGPLMGRRRKKMEQFCKTAWWATVLNLVWMGLELLLYGEVQSRRVDDIMFLPFIWMAMGN